MPESQLRSDINVDDESIYAIRIRSSGVCGVCATLAAQLEDVAVDNQMSFPVG